MNSYVNENALIKEIESLDKEIENLKDKEEKLKDKEEKFFVEVVINIKRIKSKLNALQRDPYIDTYDQVILSIDMCKFIEKKDHKNEVFYKFIERKDYKNEVFQTYGSEYILFEKNMIEMSISVTIRYDDKIAKDKIAKDKVGDDKIVGYKILPTTRVDFNFLFFYLKYLNPHKELFLIHNSEELSKIIPILEKTKVHFPSKGVQELIGCFF